ncbi:folate-binding protein [Oxalicibacterium flavum]|uniref:Folate-binding protein n=1 Tax=Oxalicibacterium flavum TaxID=179467 RepID=A0A8J2UK86_9BURK|nr:folate-binding protein YgfZ [Oxalicibacterium flavum]GGC02283.1 folate-binding protein [Oxalicibacterium flavum]
MTTWLNFLAEHGARITDDNGTPVIAFESNEAAETARTNFVTPLVHLGLIAASGEEAASFLHNQLTNDVTHLPDNQARLAGYCSPKGRLLASLLMWKSGERILLQIPREIQAAVQKRLSMFILRSKAKLNDAGEELVALGLAGPAAASALLPWFPSLPLAIYDKVETEDGVVIRHPNAFGIPRYQWITSPERAVAAWPHLTSILQPSGDDAWKLAEIEAGVPHITAATQEQFVPQMINFELIGGVNFKKGCYPGQEIVARSQYLGKLKRRMMHATVEADKVVPGTEIFSAADPQQPCGMVVNAARIDASRIDCLVEIKLASAEQDVHLGSAGGPVLAFQPLPYELTDPV